MDRSVAALREAIAGFMAGARERLRQDPARRENPPNLLEAFLVAAEQEGSGVNDDDVAGLKRRKAVIRQWPPASFKCLPMGRT